MEPKFDVEEIVVSLATISEIIFRRLQCVECNQCEPCGAEFMAALKTVTEAGEAIRTEREVG